MQVSAVGISWFEQAHYDALRAMFIDGNGLPGTYEQWLAKTEQIENELKAQGQTVVRVNIDPIEFPKWCAANNLKIDKHARMAYGNWMTARSVK